MATTKPDKVGRTRKKLAQLLANKVPGLILFPQNLESQIPVYASDQWDCASWFGGGQIDGRSVHISSWDTMKKCLKGFDLAWDGPFDIQVHATQSN
jgi:hypothetical protein